MPRCYIGLGSNIGARERFLRGAVAALAQDGRVGARSRIVETRALLPEGAPGEWNIPFLNQVVALDTSLAPEALLARLKAIEGAAGRQDRGRWGPRELDCDLLLYGDTILRTDALQLPHVGLMQRDFVLAPLAELAPGLSIPGADCTVAQALAALPAIQARRWYAAPQVMGIINLTPDSFSGDGTGGAVAGTMAQATRMLECGADMLDLGAESTRPGATALTPQAEWARLGPVLSALLTRFSQRAWEISVDSYHPETALLALEAGADCINDVSGACDPQVLEAVCARGAGYIAMHALSVPADPARVLPESADPVQAVSAWAEVTLARMARAGIPPARRVLDPGIGFGKTALQSLELIVRIEELVGAFPEARWLVGHSRKSFLKLFSDAPPAARDAATRAFSLVLAAQGVDILRVHDVEGHARMFGAWE